MPKAKKGARMQAAAANRDALLALFSIEGRGSDSIDSATEWASSDGRLRALLRTPKHKAWAQTAPPLVQITEFRGVGAPPPRIDVFQPTPRMPWGVELWADGKVFSTDWDESGCLDIATFKRGRWEQELSALANLVSEGTP